MNAIVKLREFKKEFTELVAGAINAGVPLQNMILELETEKFRLQMFLLQLNQEREAKELAQKIVPVSAGINLSPDRNGHQPH